MKYGLQFDKLWENEMVVSYIDFVLFSKLLCLCCIWLLRRIPKR